MTITIVQKIAIWFIPLIFAITVHEVAHGFVASRFGDPTAKMLGRLTLNPVKHIDLIGTLILPVILLIIGNFIFGWAKPVPVSPVNFKRPRLMMMLVALAGPVSNGLMALLWAVILKVGLLLVPHQNWARVLVLMGQAGVLLNIWLAILNLLPVPPLDGSRVVSNILPPKLAYHYDRLELYGLVFIIALIASGALSTILVPILSVGVKMVYHLFSIR